MACPCTALDIDAIAAAYYAMKESAQMSDEVKLYMRSGIRSVSTGVLDSIVPAEDGSVLVKPEVADYLLANLPGVFSRKPFSKKSTPPTTEQES